MYHKLDEEYYVENPFLNHLKNLGWEIYRQNKENPADIKEIEFTESFEPIYKNSKKFRESFREVILENILKEQIKKINPWIEEDQINEVIHKLKTPSKNSLLEANQEIHELLLENPTVSENRKTGDKSPTVKIIDFENPENNSFIAISQFKVNIPGTEKHIIPDIVLFVNGIPLVVVECKSPTKSDPINEAIEQLKRYSNRRGAKEGNEKLFWYNLFTVATINQKAKYGTITSNSEHFIEWKDPYPYSLSDIPKKTTITSQDILIQGMLSKNNLIDILHTFTIFKESSEGDIIKVVPRYQQFRATKKIIKRMKTGKTPKERGGIVWHTQGSGKSLTMMYVVRAMYHDPELKNFKILFITDRKNLEQQLSETSKGVGFTTKLATNTKTLKELLKTNTPDLVMAMIHKFQERELKTEFPILNTSNNILIMIDEAHRSQYKTLGANLEKALPNATRIAFTGTPIEKTEKTYGDYIDKYTIKQSVNDGMTVKIIYEGRIHNAELSDEEEANKKFEYVFSMLNAKEKAQVMGKIKLAYLEDKDVIRDKAKDMINHYVNKVFPNGFKAQVVASSRLAAIRYKEALEEVLKEKIEELKKNNPNNINLNNLKKLKIGVVISGAPNDPPEYAEYTNPQTHKNLIKSFKIPFNESKNGISGDVGILVVKSMLITGFDAPIEQVMYLDNILKEHNLLQAIARVNRTYKNKKFGYVVDYVGVLKHLKEALAIYDEKDIKEITEVIEDKGKLISELRYTHNLITEFFNKNGIKNWDKNNIDIDKCIEILADEIVRNEYLYLVRRFNSLVDAVLPDPEALKYLSELKALNFIRETAKNTYRDDKLSIKDATDKIREIVEEYLVSKGVNPKIKPTPIFEDEFIKNVKRKKSPKVRANELKCAIMEYINIHYEEDPELYERFSDRLKKILEEYKNNWELIEEELKKLRNHLKKGRSDEETFGFDPKKEAPFLGLLKREIYGKTPMNNLNKKDIDLLINLTKEIIKIVKQETNTVDFWESYSKQKELKSKIINCILIPNSKNNKILFEKRNEIVHKITELSYNIYG